MKPPRLFRVSLLASAAALVFTAGCSDQSVLAPNAEVAAGTTPGPKASAAAVSKATAIKGFADHVIMVRPGKRANQLVAAIQAAGGTVRRRHDDIGMLVVRGLSDAAAARLAKRAEVQGIDRDVKLQWIPSSEQFQVQRFQAPAILSGSVGAKANPRSAFFFHSFQWNMRRIDAHKAWDVTPQGAGALVCVLDTGIDPHHIDLEGKVDLAKSASMVEAEPFIDDLNFHGTFVAGLIASNGLGMASVAPGATLCAVKVLDQTGVGSFTDVIEGILYATGAGADVINMSLGALIVRQQARTLIDALHAAVELARRHGVLIVAAAGNDGLNLDEPIGLMHVPSMIDGVESVGATAPVNQSGFDALASYTNYGVRALDVMAPGGDLVDGGVIQDLILSACSQYICGDTNFYLLAAGTSFSSPHVAGIAAVVESSAGGDQGPETLAKCINRNAEKIDGLARSPMYGNGRVNVLESVRRSDCGAVMVAAGGGAGGF